MGFTTPCFIRKNTDNIRNRLKEHFKTEKEEQSCVIQ